AGQGDTNSLIIDFTAPVSQASGYILDVDANEQVTITAYPDAAGTNALQSILLKSGDPNTGNGIPTLWSFVRPTRDIGRIEIAARGWVGYDLCSSNYTPPPATPASLPLRMYHGLPI